MGWWLWNDHWQCDQVTTDEFQYYLKFQVLIDVHVVHLPDWTWDQQQSHSQQYAEFIICHSMDACIWTGVLRFSSLWRQRSFQLLLGNSFRNFYRASFKQIHILIKIGFLYWKAGLQTWQRRVKIRHFRCHEIYLFIYYEWSYNTYIVQEKSANKVIFSLFSLQGYKPNFMKMFRKIGLLFGMDYVVLWQVAVWVQTRM